jgi:hypothetical protein
MGMHFVEIFFPNGTPDPKLIWRRICDRTGLDIELTLSDEGEEGDFSSPVFILACDFEMQDRAILVLMPRSSYLEWSVIAALIDLGGIFNEEVPGFVNTKWVDRKWWWYFTLR